MLEFHSFNVVLFFVCVDLTEGTKEWKKFMKQVEKKVQNFIDEGLTDYQVYFRRFKTSLFGEDCDFFPTNAEEVGEWFDEHGSDLPSILSSYYPRLLVEDYERALIHPDFVDFCFGM